MRIELEKPQGIGELNRRRFVALALASCQTHGMQARTVLELAFLVMTALGEAITFGEDFRFQHHFIDRTLLGLSSPHGACSGLGCAVLRGE